MRDPDATPNSTTLITDYIHDANQITETIDPRGIHQTVVYDSRGQRVEQTQAAGTTVAAKTVTVYDANGNAVEVQRPRHFDANNPVFGNCKTTMTYTGQNRLKTRTEAADEATESLTYTLDGKQATRTDFRGNQWQWLWQQCCGRQPATVDPLGHGTITNTDAEGNVTHTATVEDVQSHVNVNDPTDAKTLAETTTRYDERGRPIARTVWLTPRGTVDPNNPPIAGENGIPSTDGLTTRMRYDDNLTDGVGLDADFAQHMADLGLGADSDGGATLTTSPEGRRTLSVSDGFGRTVRTTQLDSTGVALTSNTITHDTLVAVTGYGDCLETSVANALGHTNRRGTDGAGRTIQVVDAENFITQFTFDGNGNRLSVHDPNNVGDDCTYNERNRRVRCADTQEQIEHVNRQWVYDAHGNMIQRIDAKGNATLTAYDARNRRTSATDRLGGVAAFAYDTNGNQLSLTDAENQTTSYEYDLANRKVKEAYADHVAGTQAGDQDYGIREFAYDAAGRLSVATDQLGDYITNIYDMANRRTAREYRERVKQPTDPPNDADTFTFDGSGHVLTATKGRYNNTVTFGHDEAGRLASESLTIDGNTYTVSRHCDVANRLTGLTYPDGSTVSRTYTAQDELQQISYNGSMIASFTYDNGGRETARTYGNSLTATRTYRADDSVASITTPGVTSFAYSYDENKNKLARTVGGIMAPWWATAGYDASNRLTLWHRDDGAKDQLWNLTSVGDWQSFSENGTVQNRTHGPTHELTSIDAGPLGYDAKGDLTQNQDGTTFFWDFDNHLHHAVVPGGVDGIEGAHDYSYDALGRRVSKTTRDIAAGTATTVVFVSVTHPWLHSPFAGQVIAEYEAQSGPADAERKYVFGSHIDMPLILVHATSTSESLFYYHDDDLHSICAVSDNEGAVVENYAYDSHGSVTFRDAGGGPLASGSSAIFNPYTFTGRRYDPETSLYYYRSRYYSPQLGRFLSRDPVSPPPAVSLYTFVGNNPTNWIDPDGKCQPGWCDRHTARYDTTHGKKLEGLMKAAKAIGLKDVKLRVHLDLTTCCEQCDCDDTPTWTNKTTNMHITLEGEYNSNSLDLGVASASCGIYVRVGGSVSWFWRKSRCDGLHTGFPCFNMSGEVGFICEGAAFDKTIGAGCRLGGNLSGRLCFQVGQGQWPGLRGRICATPRGRCWAEVWRFEYHRQASFKSWCHPDDGGDVGAF